MSSGIFKHLKYAWEDFIDGLEENAALNNTKPKKPGFLKTAIENYKTNQASKKAQLKFNKEHKLDTWSKIKKHIPEINFPNYQINIPKNTITTEKLNEGYKSSHLKNFEIFPENHNIGANLYFTGLASLMSSVGNKGKDFTKSVGNNISNSYLTRLKKNNQTIDQILSTLKTKGKNLIINAKSYLNSININDKTTKLDNLIDKNIKSNKKTTYSNLILCLKNLNKHTQGDHMSETTNENEQNKFLEWYNNNKKSIKNTGIGIVSTAAIIGLGLGIHNYLKNKNQDLSFTTFEQNYLNNQHNQKNINDTQGKNINQNIKDITSLKDQYKNIEDTLSTVKISVAENKSINEKQDSTNTAQDSKIYQNSKDIEKLDSRVSTNETNIAKNKKDIEDTRKVVGYIWQNGTDLVPGGVDFNTYHISDSTGLEGFILTKNTSKNVDAKQEFKDYLEQLTYGRAIHNSLENTNTVEADSLTDIMSMYFSNDSINAIGVFLGADFGGSGSGVTIEVYDNNGEVAYGTKIEQKQFEKSMKESENFFKNYRQNNLIGE